MASELLVGSSLRGSVRFEVRKPYIRFGTLPSHDEYGPSWR
jgi:hypothetical protein